MARDITYEEAHMLICMAQMAGSDGEIRGTRDSMYDHARSARGKKTTKKTLDAAIEGLVEKGIIPNKNAVFPFPYQGEIPQEDLDAMRTALKKWSMLYSAMFNSEDLLESPAHKKLHSILHSNDCDIICLQQREIPLTDLDTGAYIKLGNTQVKRPRILWDWSYATMLLQKYDEDFIHETVFSLRKSGALDRISHQGTFASKRVSYRKYIMGTLSGSINAANYNDGHERDELIIA